MSELIEQSESLPELIEQIRRAITRWSAAEAAYTQLMMVREQGLEMPKLTFETGTSADPNVTYAYSVELERLTEAQRATILGIMSNTASKDYERHLRALARATSEAVALIDKQKATS